MRYENYKMDIVLLDDMDVFAGNESGSVVEDEEYNLWSIRPDRSDS